MLITSNWRWIQFDQWCSRGASSRGAPITVAIASDGYGFANACTNSQRTRPPSALATLVSRAPFVSAAASARALASTSSSSPCNSSRITGR